MAILAASGIPAQAGVASLDHFLGSGRGAALLLDIRRREALGLGGGTLAAQRLLPPGSMLKPFVLAGLLRNEKVRADTAFPCPGRLKIGNRSFDCSHPRLDTPLRMDTALAYSCNSFVAHAAEQFAPAELSRELAAWGFRSRTGLTGSDEAVGQIADAQDPDAQRLQALGSDGILVTVAEAALAYRELAITMLDSKFSPILEGLEGAVEFGTAQNARVRGASAAGKTGSAIAASGQPVSWFAGFLPSRKPEIAIAVMLAGRSGGADAAPVAGRILQAYRDRRL